MKFACLRLTTAFLAFLAFRTSGAVLYVNLNSTNPVPPYAGWSTAATNIQDAVNVSSNADLVLVTNGIYAFGGLDVYGSNRVAVTDAITVQSVNGAAATLITGQTNGVRCVFLTDGATLIGFTLTNGSTGGSGGGVLATNFSPVISNCVITANTGGFGGGVTGGTLYDCTVSGNYANSGGGFAVAILNNCLVSSNSAGFGGGSFSGTAYNCRLIGNQANNGGGGYNSYFANCLLTGNTANGSFGGGAAYQTTLINCTVVANYCTSFIGGVCGGAYSGNSYNCILYGNGSISQSSSANYYNGYQANCCATPLPTSGPGNFASDPSWGNPAAGDYHLQTNSPCVNTGNNGYVVGTIDLDGNPRVIGLIVDVGAFEFTAPTYFPVQPQSQSVPVGQTATFSALATGPLSVIYQWYFNGNAIARATNTLLVLTNVTATNDGTYFVTVSNATMTANSFSATLTVVYPPPRIVSQPTNVTILTGSNATFSVNATNDVAMTYQWQFNGTNLTDGGNIAGSIRSNLVITAATTNNAGTYRAIVANAFGSVTSSVATLTVLVPAAIKLQPANQTGVWTSNVVLAAAASGSLPLSYQWYFNNTPLTDGGRISGSTSNILSIADLQTNDAGNYQLIVTNNYGSDTSAVAVLTVFVWQPASITTEPTNLTVLLNGTATFSVTAAGTTNLGYQWYFNGATITNGGRVSGATSNTLTIAGVQTNDTGNYQVVVANFYGADTSSVAGLTMLLLAQIANQPSSQAVLLGSNITLSISAAGSTLGYQWFFNGTPLSDRGRISGSATPVLTITDVQSSDAGGYVAEASNLLSAAFSRMASLTPQAVLAPSVRYVNVSNTSPESPYLDWSTAATNIQDAVDAAVNGDEVIVTNGVYQRGGWVVYGSLTNRVAVGKALTLQSVNGPAVTIIQGNIILGNNAVRCACLTHNAALIGFTLTNGSTRIAGDVNQEESGGGIWCEDNSVVVSNCVLAGNSAWAYGGGAYRGILLNCVLTNNTASYGGAASSNTLINCTLAHNSASRLFPPSGGGAFYCTLSNCLVAGNSCGENGSGAGAYFSTLTGCVVSNNSVSFGNGGGVCFGVVNGSLICSNRAANGGGACSNLLNDCILKNNIAFSAGGGAFSNVLNNCILVHNLAANSGGGACNSLLVNCTIVSNTVSGGTAVPRGGGVFGGSALNCVVYYNAASQGLNFYFPSNLAVSFCCTTPLPTNGLGNITNAPLFINLPGSDFHLQTNSPCINSGNNAYVVGTTDFDGNPRIRGGPVDIGAYEYQTPTSIISYAWLQQFGLPTDGSADHIDSDGTGTDNWQKWIAGLNPTNPASVLAMLTPVVTNNATGVTVSWQSVNTRTYYLQRAANLAAQPAFSTIQSNIVGQAGMTSYTDTTATNGGNYFYRVGVQ